MSIYIDALSLVDIPNGMHFFSIHKTYLHSNKLAAQQPLDGSMLVCIHNNMHLKNSHLPY